MPSSPGRLSLVLALVSLALLAVPSAASTAGRIVVFGAVSGAHLTVTTEGEKVIVRGKMANARPLGCHLSVNRMRAACGLRGVAAIEMQMGASADFIEIADPLPIAVVAHLGAGSDKFIGNAEPDTCYSEGDSRNRCIGGSGNDVCITGERNSDCLGEAGDDYCKTGAGSDGCWGGPGNDTCYMGPGNDGCHGEGGNDILFGGAGADQLYGGAGSDYCEGAPGRGQSHGCEAGPGH